MDIYKRLDQLGIAIPELPKPVASYEPAILHNGLIYSSGQTGTVRQQLVHKGKLGKEITIEEGKESARLCLLNCLSELQHELGDLNRIEKFIKLTGYVASAESFGNQPEVVEGASALLLEVFGEKGRHARSALGVAELPYNAPVELELIASVTI